MSSRTTFLGRSCNKGGPSRRAIKGSFATIVAVLALAIGGAGIASATAKPKAEILNVIFGYAAANVSNTPLWNGISLGIFAKYGLDVKLIGLGSSSIVVTALNSNSITVGTVTPTGLIPAYDQGEPLQAISEYNLGFTPVMVISTSWAASHSITPKSTPQEIAKGLVGSIESAAGVPVQGQANVVMKSIGLAESQYSTAIVASSAADVTLLASGKADWYFASYPSPFLSVDNGTGFIAPINAKTVPEMAVHQISSTITANSIYAAAHPAFMKLIVRAVAAAVKYTAHHEQQSLGVLSANLPGYTRSQLLHSILPVEWATSPLQNENIWRSSVAFDVKSGQLTPPVIIKEGGIWTNAYA